MKNAYITVGISASGKTTWANELVRRSTDRVIVDLNRDTVRWEIMAEKGLTPSWANWKFKWEKDVTDRIDDAKAYAIARGWDIVFSDTNLNPDRVAALVKELEKEDYKVEIKVFFVDYDEAVRRDAARAHGVGPWVIAKQYDQFCQHNVDRRENDPSLPSVILVDIDGTVALMNGRSPFEWQRVGEDVSHEIVCAIVKGLMAQGKKIVFFSGRDGSCENQTDNWLNERFGWEFELYMRQPGDHRNDAIVKEEMYNEHIAGRYHVEAVIDDRPRVCKMWRRLGFNVIQVGNPYVDF